VPSLRKQPGFTTMAVVMRAVGIGGDVAIFRSSTRYLLKPLPFADPARLMIVTCRTLSRGSGCLSSGYLSYPKYRAFREHQRVSIDSPLLERELESDRLESPERIVARWSSRAISRCWAWAQRAAPSPQTEQGLRDSAPLASRLRFWMRRFGGDRNLFGVPSD